MSKNGQNVYVSEREIRALEHILSSWSPISITDVQRHELVAGLLCRLDKLNRQGRLSSG